VHLVSVFQVDQLDSHPDLCRYFPAFGLWHLGLLGGVKPQLSELPGQDRPSGSCPGKTSQLREGFGRMNIVRWNSNPSHQWSPASSD
jgi:hypothetical protein